MANTGCGNTLMNVMISIDYLIYINILILI